MHLNLNQAISQRITNLESEIERLKSSEISLSRPSAVQELWDKIRAIQNKINRLKESNHPDTSMHFRERNEIRNPVSINLSELNPLQNEGRSWGYLIGGTMLVGAVAALGFYLLSNMSVSSSPNPPTPPNPRPGCGNQDKPPATPPCPPPAPPKPKKHHHKPTWHIRSTKVFGVPVGIKIEKK